MEKCSAGNRKASRIAKNIWTGNIFYCISRSLLDQVKLHKESRCWLKWKITKMVLWKKIASFNFRGKNMLSWQPKCSAHCCTSINPVYISLYQLITLPPSNSLEGNLKFGRGVINYISSKENMVSRDLVG